MKNLVYLSTIILLGFYSCNNSKSNIQETKHAKNVILLIGDGMGVTQIYAAMSVADSALCLESFKNVGFHKTYSANDYITDSGAGGTALSFGVKTKNHYIAADTSGKPVKTILEYAEENHLATGLVVTCAITHATPATFIAHEVDRSNYENIARDFLDVDIDLFIGGGKKYFNNRKDSLNLIDSLKYRNYHIIDGVENLDVNQERKFAVFTANSDPSKMVEGRGDMLPESTEKAIKILSKSEKGFFLMVEGSQIDWGGHNNDIDYVTSELIDFDHAIAKALEFAKKDGETLVIVTADHECGGLTLTGGDVKTKTIQANFSTGDHTSVMVPVFAFGPGAEEFGGIYQNTDVFKKMMKAFGFRQ